MPTEEWILNWTNSVYPNRQAKINNVREKFSQLIEEGYSAIDASELLIASGEADVDMSDEIFSEFIGDLSTAENKRVIPRHYSDVREKVEDLVKNMSAADVMNIISGNRYAIGRFSKREAADLDSLLRLARSQRGEDKRIVEAIHSSLESHIQNAILDTDLMSEEQEFSMRWASDGLTALASDDHGTYRVSLKDNSCTCDRYVMGGFKHLGLMCEHVVAAHKENLGSEWDDAAGTRKVFSQSSNDGVRSAWCDRLRKEIDITSSCVKAECPFFGGDGEDFIRCGFAPK